MADKTYRGKSRDRKLSESEAARVQRLRKLIEAEIPPARQDAIHSAIAKLRNIREAQGVSLGELSRRTGISRGNIARLESQKNATLKTLERYAEGLGCTIEIEVLSSN